MKNKKIIAVLALVFGIAAQALGATVYVSKEGDDSTGSRDTGSPFKTIQAAVDAAKSGDTVEIGEGDYSDLGGSYAVTPSGEKFQFQVTNVVKIGKAITLKGAGRGKTFITGRYGDGTAQDGSANTWAETGNGAVRCIYATSGCTIRDLTIRNGSTVRAKMDVNNSVDIAGGIVASSCTVYVYDCDITDCRAGTGAATSYDVRCCRCYFARNKAKNVCQVMYRNNYTYNCLFEDNGCGTAGWIFTNVQEYKVVNCTFINNKMDRIFQINSSSTLVASGYNCLSIGTRILDGGAAAGHYHMLNSVQDMTGGKLGTYGTNCMVGVNKALQYFSPAENDWRSVEGNDIVSKGDASLVTTILAGKFPSDELNKDYNGNDRFVVDSGTNTVSVGCFEPTSTVSADDYLGSFKFAGGAKVTKGSKTYDDNTIVTGRWWGLEGGGRAGTRWLYWRERTLRL